MQMTQLSRTVGICDRQCSLACLCLFETTIADWLDVVS